MSILKSCFTHDVIRVSIRCLFKDSETPEGSTGIVKFGEQSCSSGATGACVSVLHTLACSHAPDSEADAVDLVVVIYKDATLVGRGDITLSFESTAVAVKWMSTSEHRAHTSHTGELTHTC